jgi:uncharacterized protein
MRRLPVRELNVAAIPLVIAGSLLSAFPATSSEVAASASYEAAAKELRSRAEAGETEAMMDLATLYKLGRGFHSTVSKLNGGWSETARRGNSLAKQYVEIRDRKTVPVQAEVARSIERLRRRADDGDAGAQYELGMLYVNGIGVRRP